MRALGDENVPTLRLVDFCLRFLVIPLSVASIWLTVTNHQDNTSLGSIHFTKIKGLKYMVSISAISGGYALIALAASCLKHLVDKAWVFFVSDQVMAYLMVTSRAAMAELDYLAYNGDTEVTWSDACSSYGRFCSRLNLILVVNAIALFCFFGLAVISAYRIFSRFEPPFVASKDGDEQVT